MTTNTENGTEENPSNESSESGEEPHGENEIAAYLDAVEKITRGIEKDKRAFNAVAAAITKQALESLRGAQHFLAMRDPITATGMLANAERLLVAALKAAS